LEEVALAPVVLGCHDMAMLCSWCCLWLCSRDYLCGTQSCLS